MTEPATPAEQAAGLSLSVEEGLELCWRSDLRRRETDKERLERLGQRLSALAQQLEQAALDQDHLLKRLKVEEYDREQAEQRIKELEEATAGLPEAEAHVTKRIHDLGRENKRLKRSISGGGDVKLVMRIPAPQDSRFTQEAAESMVGQMFDAKREWDGRLAIEGVGTILAAKVVEDGRFIEAEIEWPNGIFREDQLEQGQDPHLTFVLVRRAELFALVESAQAVSECFDFEDWQHGYEELEALAAALAALASEQKPGKS
jgi:hypothetical protein